jgi:actin-related protein 8
LRILQEERRNRLTNQAKEKDRARAQGAEDVDGDVTMDLEDDAALDENGETTVDQETAGSKVIVIHPGSQNLRIGLASDALPKTVPMVIARRSKHNESEEGQGEPSPKRLKLDDGTYPEPEKQFDQEFAAQYNKMCAELKIHMRANKRRVLPNSKELVVNYNSRMNPEHISEHNDPLRIDWTEVPKDPKQAPEYYIGKEALRVPDDSTPRYKLFWPLQRGWYNEGEYNNKSFMFEDISIIIEEAIKTQLNLRKKKDWAQYGCVFVIPDLYDRQYVIQSLEMLLRDFGFGKVCFIQESLAATFGAAFTTCCVVDVGAQKTSIACVEEGMVIDNSRVNLKIGGADVTDTFFRMMLYDHFPYEEINLKRRYDFLLAEELKAKVCTMNETDISVQLFDFHVRAPHQDTKKYGFKAYDEVLLAPQGLFQPSIFDHAGKLSGRRKLLGPSLDLYDGSPNDPISTAQSEIINIIAPPAPEPAAKPETNGVHVTATPSRQKPDPLARVAETDLPSSNAGTPAPDDNGDTPAPAIDNGPSVPSIPACYRDDVLPVVGLDTAILTSITHGARGDDRKTRDFMGGIMVIGGGAQVPGFMNALEERLRMLRPGYTKEILIGPPPRELDPQGVVWKGGSVFGKLRSTGDMWIGKLEFDRLGSRCLAYKCLWGW